MSNKTTIIRANEEHYGLIVAIGKISVAEAHRRSCSSADLDTFLQNNYNDEAIKKELADPKNIYHLIYYNEQPAGFSKIILGAPHPNIQQTNVTKLDRIYLLKEFYGLKIGYQLLSYNIQFSKEYDQCGMWLFTWTGNHRAVDFYLKAGFEIIGDHLFKVSQNHYNPNHHMMLKY